MPSGLRALTPITNGLLFLYPFVSGSILTTGARHAHARYQHFETEAVVVRTSLLASTSCAAATGIEPETSHSLFFHNAKAPIFLWTYFFRWVSNHQGHKKMHIENVSIGAAGGNRTRTRSV